MDGGGEDEVAPPSGGTAPGAVDERAVVEALHSVLESSTFRAAPRARDLLSFTVTETIAGRGHLLNERVVCRVALGRPPTVDTRTDASARVQARRTRDLLDRYYAGEGNHDPVRISIPVGQYAAAFVRWRGGRRAALDRPIETTSTTRGPVLAIVHLRHRSAGIDRRVAAGLTESLVHTLSRFPGLQVIGPIVPASSNPAPDVLAISERARADYVLHGGVSATNQTVRVTTHLATSTGEVRWSETFEHDVEAFTGFDAEDDVLAHVAAAVGDFGGVVFREPFHPRLDQGDPRVAEALRRYYAFLDELTPLIAPQVVADLEEALRIEPANAHVLASLAFTHAVDVLLRGAAATASTAEAERLGRLALSADPTNAVANNVLGIVALVRDQHARARKHADAALWLAPHHPGSAYVAGMIIGAAGEWDRGIEIIRGVVRVNPFGPNHRRTLLAIAALMDGDPAEALAEASLLHFPGHIYGPLVKAICFAEFDMLDDAAAELDTLVALAPGFLDDPAAVIGAAPTIPPHAVDHLVGRIAALIRPRA